MDAAPAVLVTAPSPWTVTLSASVATGGGVPPVKVAVTEIADVPMSAVQFGPDEVEHPDQNTLAPVLGLAVSATLVFGSSEPVHVCGPGPHVMPPPDTVPFPLTVTVSCTRGANVAVTERSLSIWTVHVSCAPVQSPLQAVRP